MNRIEHLEIIENKPIAKGVYRLLFALPGDYPQPIPGQFVNIYLNDKSRLLPRPLSICDWSVGSASQNPASPPDFVPVREVGMLTLVYAVVGEGTSILSQYTVGTALRVSTPLGNGFTVSQERTIIIGGGLGVAPMLYLSKQMPGAQVVLGFRSETFLTESFYNPNMAEIATEDGSNGFKGNVIDLLKNDVIAEKTQLFACGPKPMLAALTRFAKERSLPLQCSLEERMGCGYGACVGCVCKTTNGNKKVCEDGPVFMAEEVCWDA